MNFTARPTGCVDVNDVGFMYYGMVSPHAPVVHFEERF